MNDEQVRMVKDIAHNRESYLKIAGKKKDTLEELYREFQPAFRKYYLNLTNEVSSRRSYDTALRSHKIDPSIAGGVAQGLAGLGAGICAAGSASQRNKEIENQRTYYRTKVSADACETDLSEKHVLDLAMRIDRILNEISEVRSFREKAKENNYIKAKELMKNSKTESIKEAIDIFTSLGDYKDSASLAMKSKNIKKRRELLFNVITSLVFALFVVFITGLPVFMRPIVFLVVFLVGLLCHPR